jgi:hypothetical protein
MPSVPNTETFSLQNVYDSVHGHAASTTGDLSSCFLNAVGSYFDPTYNTSSYAPAASQKRFRNYTPVTGTPATISMAVTYVNNTAAGVYNYTLVVTIVATSANTGSFSFYLDFLSGSVPVGQSEARQAAIARIPELPSYQTGAGTVRTISTSWASGTSTLTYNLTYVNDNWDYPRATSSFRLRLIAGTNTQLSVTNSTVTNGTTDVRNVAGITTTFITVYDSASGGRIESGEMIDYHYNTTISGGTSDGYKDVLVKQTFNTTSYSTSKKFVAVYYDGTYRNYMPYSQYHGDVVIDTLQTMTSGHRSWYNRFMLYNRSGSTSTFSYTFEPYKYCSFTTQNYSQTINSYSPSGHPISLRSFSGNGDYLPADIIVYPGTDVLSAGDTFSFKFVAHCPTGGYIDFHRPGAANPLYDGDSYSVPAGDTYATEGIRFGSVSSPATNDEAKVTISGQGFAKNDGINVYFQKTDQYVELVPTTTNISTDSHYPYMFGYYGLLGNTTVWASISKSNYNGYNVSCAGGSNGTITVGNVGGGSGSGYQVKLNSGGTYVNFTIPGITYSSLPLGSYTIYVKDGAGNVTTYPVDILAPPSQTATIISVNYPTCGFNNGSFSLHSTGGVWPKDYYLYRDATSPYETSGGTLYATYTNFTSETYGYRGVYNLPPGGYYMTAIDANGCSITSAITVLPIPC